VVQFAEFGGEVAVEGAEIFLLDRQPVGPVGRDELRQLAGPHLVVALLDDHEAGSVWR
jgi:hypothetical protein